MAMDILEKPEFAPAETDKRWMILIIDDDEALADVLSRRLQQQGFVTLMADSGKAGLAMARSDLPGLIVLDLRLPDLDGFEICRRLADSPETCGIPVIILSALERPDIVRQCRSAGCHYFVRKPYDPNALLVLIRQSIEEANAWEDV